MLTSYRTSPQANLWLDELIVDNFAGGGASTGIEQALGRANFQSAKKAKVA